MMAVEGISVLRNEDYSAELSVLVTLKTPDGETVAQLDLKECDGACMGYSMWSTGEFGEVPIARKLPPRQP